MRGHSGEATAGTDPRCFQNFACFSRVLTSHGGLQKGRWMSPACPEQQRWHSQLTVIQLLRCLISFSKPFGQSRPLAIPAISHGRKKAGPLEEALADNGIQEEGITTTTGAPQPYPDCVGSNL